MNLTNTLFHHQIPFTCFLHSTNKTSCPSFLFQHPKHFSSSFHVKLSSSKTAIQKTYNFQDDEEEEFEEDDEDNEDDEDIFVPLSNMRQWSRNKPKGFGEGKVYDTSLEDKLLQELEQTRLPKDGNPNSPKPKEEELEEDGITRVRLFNLPKKKKIHRDLQAAFKPFTGITNIIPAVSGNQKTRDPVCKGFAFVHFKSHKDANRFVDIISTQPITFGKVQKQIRCEIMRPSPPVKDRTESPLPVPETPLDPCVAFDMLKTGDDDLVSATDDDNDNGNSFGNVVEQKHEAEVSSESSKEQKAVVVREKGKKKTTRAKKETPKRSILGSANRLKMKEKVLLTSVFSKYGGISSD